MNYMRTALMAGVAFVGASAVTESAHAQIFSGGSTLASSVYRQLFDCFGYPLNTSIMAVSSSCSGYPNGQAQVGSLLLYDPVGSGGGKRGLVHHDSSTSTSTGLGSPGSSNTVPYTSPYFAYPYPTIHFAGSDDPINSSDLNTYNSLSGPANYGNIIQIPAFGVGVAIAFNGKDGNGVALNIQNTAPAGGSSGLNLSRQALCGIFSGHITQWNNSLLTALNNNQALGTGNITVVHRSDGSGTTFITSNALITQCNGVTGPNSESDPTVVLYNFPWTDANASCPALPVEGSNKINWPDLGTNQCGVTIANPTGATFANGNGSAGVAGTGAGGVPLGKIVTTNGAIGYISPDFVQPINTAPLALAAANIQSQYDISNSTGTFEPPTAAGTAHAMSEVKPYFSDGPGVANPFNWTNLGNVPNPILKGSYPLAGYTWLDFYQCYQTYGVQYTLFQLIVWLYQDPNAAAIINANGFATMDPAWLNYVGYIITNPQYGMNSLQNGGCNGIVGAN